MPLDAQTQALLEIMEAQGLPPLESLPVADGRAMAIQMTEEIGGAPPEVGQVENRVMPGPAGDIPLRVYRPQGSGPFPGLVFFHGGGWVVCDLDTHDVACRTLTNAAGAVVVSVDYRLAPEHPFPAAPEDCFAATQWVVQHAQELEIDPNRVVVGGDSAGGNLATVIAMRCRDEGGPQLAGQLLIYPVTDPYADTETRNLYGEGYFLTKPTMDFFSECYLPNREQATHPYAAPLFAPDLTNLPPAFVATMEFDPLRDEGEAYVRRLEEAGVPTTHKLYKGSIHGCLNMLGVLDIGKEILADSAAWLKML